MKPQLTTVKTIRTEDMSLDDLHEQTIAIGREAFDKKGKAPFLWVMRERNKLIYVHTPWDGDDEKRLHTQIIQIAMEVMGVDAYSFMTEAWVSLAAPGTEPEDMVQPKDDPDHEDVLMITTHSRERRLSPASKSRPRHGNIWKVCDGGKCDGN